MKIRPPSACNPARFARHCLARVTRDSSVRLLARERCGIRARCVRVLDARGNSRARAVVVVVVRSRPSSRMHAPARFQRLEQPSSSARARRRRGGRGGHDRDEDGGEGVRSSRDDEARRTTRGEQATTTTTRRRGDEGARRETRSWSRRRAGASIQTSSFMHARIRFECVRWRFCRII